MTQRTFTLTVSGVPSWFSSLAHKQWGTPTNNSTAIAANRHWVGASAVKDPNSGTMSGATGHAGVIQAYSGMCVDQTRKMVILLGNGGHGDYYGNEVYSVDLLQTTPQWTRRRNTTVQSLSAGVNYSKYSDGRPASDHTGQINVEAEGRWLKPGMCGVPTTGNQQEQQWWEYAPFAATISGRTTVGGTAEDWIDLGSTHASTTAGTTGTLACFDTVDRQVIKCAPNAVYFQSIDTMGAASADLTNTNGVPTSNAMSGGIDTTNRLLVVRVPQTNRLYCLRLNGNSGYAGNASKLAAMTAVTTTGTNPPDHFGMHWHAASNAWLSWAGSNASGSLSLVKLTPVVSGGMYTSAAWTTVTGFTGLTPPAMGSTAGMYGKINLIRDMGDGTAAFVVLPAYQSPDLYVCRLTGTV